MAAVAQSANRGFIDPLAGDQLSKKPGAPSFAPPSKGWAFGLLSPPQLHELSVCIVLPISLKICYVA
jgi:hypothetical protein